MTYRDDLDAAQARASAAERRAALAEKELAAAIKPSQPIVPIPQRCAIDDQGDTLSIKWRWFRLHHLALVGFLVLWNAFLIGWYTHASTAGAPFVVYLFPIVHVVVGFALTYGLLAGLLNRTTVRVSRDGLEIRHAPLPWRGNRTFARTELTQLFVRDELTRWSSNIFKLGGNRQGTLVHRLCAVGADGRELRLLTLDDVGHATYLEKTIEARLGIIDKPVA